MVKMETIWLRARAISSWLRVRANSILGILLVASISFLGLCLAHSISHIIVSFFITLVCFSNGWHKELSPTAFQEWKRPRESVLAPVLLVLVLSLLAHWLSKWLLNWLSYHMQVKSNPTSPHSRPYFTDLPSIKLAPATGRKATCICTTVFVASVTSLVRFHV